MTTTDAPRYVPPGSPEKDERLDWAGRGEYGAGRRLEVAAGTYFAASTDTNAALVTSALLDVATWHVCNRPWHAHAPSDALPGCLSRVHARSCDATATELAGANTSNETRIGKVEGMVVFQFEAAIRNLGTPNRTGRG